MYVNQEKGSSSKIDLHTRGKSWGGGGGTKCLKALAANRHTGACARSSHETNSLSCCSISSSQVVLRNYSCGKFSCPLKEWHRSNFFSWEQVLLGALEMKLPGFLQLCILWLIS